MFIFTQIDSRRRVLNRGGGWLFMYYINGNMYNNKNTSWLILYWTEDLVSDKDTPQLKSKYRNEILMKDCR